MQNLSFVTGTCTPENASAAGCEHRRHKSSASLPPKGRLCMQCSARLLDVMKETYQVPISVYNLPIFLSRLARGTIVVTDAVVPRVVVGYTKRSLVVPTSDSIPKVEYNPSYPEGLLTYIGRSLTFKDGQRDSRSWWQCNNAAVFARGILISAELDHNYASMVKQAHVWHTDRATS